MPTLDEWQNALLMLKEIKIISDPQLVHAVNRRPNSKSHVGPRKQATVAQQVFPNRFQQIMPLEILGAMGLITSPRIDNLVDLCSTWARIRYIWAFNPEAPYPYHISRRLRLSSEAHNIDFHQKTLLSDEIGMGMAALVMDKFLYGYNPVDVDVALQQNSIMGLNQVNDASPDYIFQSKINNSYLVVECKGTRSGYNMVLDQLKRGTEQVRALSFPSGTVPCYVIATEMSLDHTYVYVIDPPDDNNDSKKDIVIRNEAAFRQAVRDVQVANIYRYIGAFNRAYQIERSNSETRRGIQVQDPPNETYVEELQVNFVGMRQEFRIPGEFGLVSVFQGIPEQIYLGLNRRAYDDIDGIVDGYFTLVQRVAKKTPTENQANPGFFSFQRNDERLSVRLYRRDGTLLQVEISS
jgi:hypothetical protein